MQHFLSIDALFTGVVALVFGVIVLAKNKRNIVNQTLFLLTATTAFWSFSYWQWLSIYDNKELALWWVRVLSVGSTFIPVFYFHWVISLLGLNKKFKKIIFLSYSFLILFLFLSFSPFYIKDVVAYKNIFSFWPVPGFVYTLYLFLFYAGLVFYAIYLLSINLKHAIGQKRFQIRYVIIGSLIGFGGGATNFFLWYNIDILPWGTVLVVSYPIIFSYSIIRHRLMDIKFVMRRYSVNLTAMAFVLLPLLLFRFLINKYFPDFSTFFEFILLFSAVAFFPAVKNWTYHLANKFFFSSLYDPTQVIAEISDKLRSTLNINQIYGYIYDTLNGALHIKSFGILKYHRDQKVFSTEFNINFNIGRRVKFERNKYLQDTFTKKNKPIIIEEVKREHYNNKTKELIDIMEAMKVEMLYPLIVKNRIVGLMVLGVKETADMYTDEDLQILKIIASQSAIAIENAMLYEETKNFSERMEKEVKIATADLRAANEKLKKLDAAKSEFISIASHQLRTPLTVIKGYISMMTEGSFGELSDPIKDSLSKVYESNERLISLVENLLNISRIESGRLKFSFEVVQLEDMVVSVCEELLGTAKEKNIKLEFRKPKHALAKVKIDTEKIRQVIMNLIDNAIKYTDKGEVIVNLKRDKDSLLFCVKDNGLGIPPQDLPHLFKKFARGKNAMLTHTEGTGLGLFVAKQMIEFHKGKIWAESEGENKGAKFCFLLPIVEIEKG